MPLSSVAPIFKNIGAPCVLGLLGSRRRSTTVFTAGSTEHLLGSLAMRWLTIVVALSALLLVVVGCGGGDDEAASDTTTLTDTTTDETTTDDTTTDETTTDETTTDDDSGDLGDLASGECADLVESSTKLSEAFGAAADPSGDNFDDVSKFFDEFAENAPEEIRADFQVLAEAWDVYAEILPDLQVEPGQTPDPEALAKLQAALASVDQQKVAAASERISAWTTANCSSG